MDKGKKNNKESLSNFKTYIARVIRMSVIDHRIDTQINEKHRDLKQIYTSRPTDF